ncbi:hypothetical protein [Pseudomonas sp. ok266]|uniref:hypothetical protein n=1 Tax=Pseudomonas sp. ok266 TaxID=1761896 RepID=UPI0008D10D1E|nr:hypothetical protein [Pseudomonas sp. ok266]SEN81143.1 hypothetical protein SAMN04487856_104319 [Pseudomonas sp. ok266]
MTTSTPPDNTVLVLYPPKVNGQTTPVVGAHIGVPLVASDLVADGKGAVVIVDPPLSGTMDPGDVMELWLEGESATLDSETITNPNAKTQLRTKGRLHPDKVNKMYYTVRRGSDNIGTSTPSLEILYNRVRPGLKDRFPQIDGHSELDLDLSDLIKQGVGKDFVSAPVCFSYPYCRAYDTISLKCNGEIKTFPVSKDQAPEPPNPGSEMPTTVCFTVEREFLDKAKRQNKVLNFSYTVTDQLRNGPDPDAVWSAAVAVNEDLDGRLLDTPILREIAGDTADEPGIIDLKKLGSNPLLVYISTVDPRFEPGDKIEATYTAKIAGQDDKTVVLTGQVETDDIGNKITCVLKVLNKDVIVATSVSVKYKLLRKLDDTLKAESNIATATVVGDYMELKPAGVQQANGNTLAPMTAVSRLTIVVPQGTTLPTDRLSVSWIPEPGTHAEGTYISDPRPISEVGLNVDAPPALVAFCLGGRVTVSYTITRGNGQPQPSDPFILNVQELPQAELIAPRLKEASNAGEGSELNLAELTPEGKMWCSGFPFNAVGQYVWLLFEGTNADGSAYEKYIWAAPFAFVNDDWVRNGYFEATAPYEDLKGLKDGTPLSMEMWVAFGKSEDLGLAKRFLVRTYVVKATPALKIDTTPMVLDGYQLYPAAAPNNPPFEKTNYVHPDAQQTRGAIGGTPPYQYSSSNLSVAYVDSATGHVVSTGVGDARITVRDLIGTTASYEVSCKNVYELVCSPHATYHYQAGPWVASVGAQLFPFHFRTTSTEPFALVTCYSFEYLGPNTLLYWYRLQSATDWIPVCGPTRQRAYWHKPPYVAGINSIAAYANTYLFPTLGYRPRNGDKNP